MVCFESQAVRCNPVPAVHAMAACTHWLPQSPTFLVRFLVLQPPGWCHPVTITVALKPNNAGPPHLHEHQCVLLLLPLQPELLPSQVAPCTGLQPQDCLVSAQVTGVAAADTCMAAAVMGRFISPHTATCTQGVLWRQWGDRQETHY